MIPNTPAAWSALRAKVQHATRNLSDAELINRAARLQLRLKQNASVVTYSVLRELHTEQHRRRWACDRV
jgi:hypothetical protein